MTSVSARFVTTLSNRPSAVTEMLDDVACGWCESAACWIGDDGFDLGPGVAALGHLVLSVGSVSHGSSLCQHYSRQPTLCQHFRWKCIAPSFSAFSDRSSASAQS